MALTDRDYKCTLRGFYNDELSNPIENVFWYKADGAGGSAGLLATAWTQNVLPPIATMVTESLVFAQFEVLNLVDMQDFTTATFSVPGDRDAAISNRWDALAFQYLRPVRGMNNGSKRFGPIARLDYSNQTINTALLVTIDLLSDALVGPLPGLGVPSYSPCCVKTVKVPNANGNGKFHYEPDDLFICNSVAYVGISHQDSRG